MYYVQVYIRDAVGISEFQTEAEAVSYADSVSEGSDEIIILDSEGEFLPFEMAP